MVLFRRSHASIRSSCVVAATLGGALAPSVAVSAAQETATVRPASIHLGSCETSGEAVAELNDLTVMFDDSDDQAGGSDAGTPSTPVHPG